MPDGKTLKGARKDKREGKSPSTQASEFVREEIEHIRTGKHGARSAKLKGEPHKVVSRAARSGHARAVARRTWSAGA
jgi:hypothetical protein